MKTRTRSDVDLSRYVTINATLPPGSKRPKSTPPSPTASLAANPPPGIPPKAGAPAPADPADTGELEGTDDPEVAATAGKPPGGKPFPPKGSPATDEGTDDETEPLTPGKAVPPKVSGAYDADHPVQLDGSSSADVQPAPAPPPKPGEPGYDPDWDASRVEGLNSDDQQLLAFYKANPTAAAKWTDPDAGPSMLPEDEFAQKQQGIEEDQATADADKGSEPPAGATGDGETPGDKAVPETTDKQDATDGGPGAGSQEPGDEDQGKAGDTAGGTSDAEPQAAEGEAAAEPEATTEGGEPGEAVAPPPDKMAAAKKAAKPVPPPPTTDNTAAILYERVTIGARVVDLYPDGTWAVPTVNFDPHQPRAADGTFGAGGTHTGPGHSYTHIADPKESVAVRGGSMEFKAEHPHAKFTPNKDLPDATRPPVPEKAVADHVNNYSHGYDGPMNKALRTTNAPPPGEFGADKKGKPPKDGPVMFHDVQGLIDRCKPFGPPPVPVERALEVTSAVTDRLEKAARKAMTSGEPVGMRGFVSTSTSPGEFLGNVVFKVNAVHGLDMSPYSHFPQERELLLGHGSKFKVTKVTRDKDGVTIHLDQHAPGSAAHAVPTKIELNRAWESIANAGGNGTGVRRDRFVGGADEAAVWVKCFENDWGDGPTANLTKDDAGKCHGPLGHFVKCGPGAPSPAALTALVHGHLTGQTGPMTPDKVREVHEALKQLTIPQIKAVKGAAGYVRPAGRNRARLKADVIQNVVTHARSLKERARQPAALPVPAAATGGRHPSGLRHEDFARVERALARGPGHGFPRGAPDIVPGLPRADIPMAAHNWGTHVGESPAHVAKVLTHHMDLHEASRPSPAGPSHPAPAVTPVPPHRAAAAAGALEGRGMTAAGYLNASESTRDLVARAHGSDRAALDHHFRSRSPASPPPTPRPVSPPPPPPPAPHAAPPLVTAVPAGSSTRTPAAAAAELAKAGVNHRHYQILSEADRDTLARQHGTDRAALDAHMRSQLPPGTHQAVGAGTHTLPSGGTVRMGVGSLRPEAEQVAVVGRLLGHAPDAGVLAAAGNAAAGATVTVRTGHTGDSFQVSSEKSGSYEAQRTFNRDADGKLYVKNAYFAMEFDKLPGKSGRNAKDWVKRDKDLPDGLTMLDRQVTALQTLGVTKIKTHAARSDPHPEYGPGMNGYYTWPRFGYDANLKEHGHYDTLPPHLKSQVDANPVGSQHAASVLSLMHTQEGRDWWKKNGTDLFHAEFDMTPGSLSHRTLAAYKIERAAAGGGEA